MANHINDTVFSSFPDMPPTHLNHNRNICGWAEKINSLHLSSPLQARATESSGDYDGGDPAAARVTAMPLPPILWLSPLNDDCDVIAASSLLLSLSAWRCPR